MTILICARDAAATIERAVRSCLAETGVPILLVDDHSRDDTVMRARAIAGDHLRVIPAPDPGGIPLARQAALEAVGTEYAAWLDADDEWVSGRAARLSEKLVSGFDIAAESIDLIDGATGAWLRRMTVPALLHRPGGAVRLFERNFLPGDSQVAFRTQLYRDAGGYDPEIFGAESFDLLLRAIARGGRLSCGDEVGYRMYAYSGSVSRNLGRQRESLKRTLKKYDYETVRQLYVSNGWSPRIAAWALVSMALFREEPEAALGFLEQASPEDADPQQVLEADGPWPFREGWRRAFQRGTINLLLGGRDAAAARDLRLAHEMESTPEGANNLGVALARLGRRPEANVFFDEAAARFPGYQDAVVNRAPAMPDRITTHPLRRDPSRSEYGVAKKSEVPITPANVSTGARLEIPLPPPELQYHVFSRAVSDEEFLEAGRLCAESLESALGRVGLSTACFKRVLDFGCGCARVLRHFAPLLGTVELHGSDVADSVISWDKANVRGFHFHRNDPEPPLPFADGAIDYLWSISVFSHLPQAMALRWLQELRRVLREGGIALVTVHGPFRFEEDRVRGYLKALQIAEFERAGFTYAHVFSDGILPDWYQNAYMTEDYARRTYGELFEILDYMPRGMMGRQDIVLMRKRVGS